MSDIKYYGKPGIDMSGLVPPDAERMTRKQMEERMAKILAEAEGNSKGEPEGDDKNAPRDDRDAGVNPPGIMGRWDAKPLDTQGNGVL